MKEKVALRKKEYEGYERINIPTHFALKGNAQPPFAQIQKQDYSLKGRGCTPGIIKGKIRIFKEFSIPSVIDFDIMVASHTDPGWTALIGVSKGMIIEHGGILSHASIVSRDLGIPTVIGVQNACSIFSDGQMVELNGTTGMITLL